MSNARPKVFIAGVGMITAVGANAETTTAAVNAGISAFRDSVHFNKNFNPMRMALIPEDALPPLNPDKVSIAGLTSRERRMLRLATPALEEVMQSVPLTVRPPLFLAVSESVPDCPSIIQPGFIDHLVAQTGIKIDRAASRMIATGRAGGLQAIDLAFKYFESTGKDVALVGGVDTYLDSFLLGVLDSQDRILAENIQDGFAPGEAAGFLMLVSERVVDKLPNKALAALYAPGLAEESGHRYSQEPYLGDGLSRAFQLAIENAGGQPIHTIYASLNGEQFSAKELGVASIRNKGALVDDFEVVHPADCFGDIGAAFAPVMIGMTGKSRLSNTLCYCASEQAYRGAVYVTQ